MPGTIVDAGVCVAVHKTGKIITLGDYVYWCGGEKQVIPKQQFQMTGVLLKG